VTWVKGLKASVPVVPVQVTCRLAGLPPIEATIHATVADLGRNPILGRNILAAYQLGLHLQHRHYYIGHLQDPVTVARRVSA